jgi:cysteine-rich repeat protein
MSKRIFMGFIGAVAFALTMGLATASLAGPPTICGDGLMEGAELCDDGNTVDGDGCSSNCIPEICGDAILENNGIDPDEECDDGNTDDGDGCEGDCTCGPCGDGFVCGDETCDDGNAIDDDECNNLCELNEFCGDGIVNGDEECDDGNTIPDDFCSNECTLVDTDTPVTPTKDDQKCINGINKSWGGVIKATNKVAGKCVKDISNGKVQGTLTDCAGAGDVGKAYDKTTNSNQKSCVGKTTEGVHGYIGDPVVVNESASAATIGAHAALLGDASNIVPKDDKDNAKCQQEVDKGLVKYLDGLASDANKAKKDCLKGKKVAQCDTGAALAEAMTTNGQKSTKALSSWNTKTGKKCSDVATIPTNFPGECSSAATFSGLVACSAIKARCSFCETLNAADGLSVDCDNYADASETGSCDPPPPLCECGDGEVCGEEVCDDGNTINGDGCENDCTETIPVIECGDGVVGGDEECDDGNTIDDDLCTNACLHNPMCGDGTVTPPEACDDGNTIDGDGCESDCTETPVCGDGAVTGDEECDDGNTIDDDLCTNACLHNPMCGDSVITPPEQCDDGNTIADDGCENDCTVTPLCGDGLVSGTEECDDGNTIDDDLCTNACLHNPMCGDGTVTPPEECDDGNTIDGDGCETDCTVTP